MHARAHLGMHVRCALCVFAVCFQLSLGGAQVWFSRCLWDRTVDQAERRSHLRSESARAEAVVWDRCAGQGQRHSQPAL